MLASLFSEPSRRFGPWNNNEQHLVVNLLASSPAYLAAAGSLWSLLCKRIVSWILYSAIYIATSTLLRDGGEYAMDL